MIVPKALHHCFGKTSDDYAVIDFLQNRSARDKRRLAQVPSGALTVWKAVRRENGEAVVAKLRIPKDALRLRAFFNRPGDKHRASKAKVLGFYAVSKDRRQPKRPLDLKRAYSDRNRQFAYTVGRVVVPSVESSFDPNPFNSCRGGIHFFLTYKQAASYLC